MKIWVTKYALSKGILVFENAERPKLMFGEKNSTNMVVAESPSGLNGKAYFHYKEWHETEEAALARAREMRDNFVANMKKKIAKLEKLFQ